MDLYLIAGSEVGKIHPHLFSFHHGQGIHLFAPLFENRIQGFQGSSDFSTLPFTTRLSSPQALNP
jgi:hypothetical protein